MYHENLLAGRAALITGGGTGLGRVMALRFASLGAKVFLAARREEPLRKTAGEIRAAGGAAAWATCDVRDFAAVEKMVEAAEKEFGGVDTLVNNAAGNFLARTERLSPNAFAAVTGIVLHGTFHCTLALGRRWIAAGRAGTVLNIVTTYAACGSGSGFVVPSACAKAGVLAMTRSLAVEWARHRIRLNAIAPGPFPTEGAWSRLMPTADFEKRALEAHPMKRFGRHEELADLAVYLVSEQSGYVNGECVVIDGGLWLRGAGEFNDAVEIPDAAWEAMEAARGK
jgi:NAD(P)-dependent dehydrogenase (short-subunit alcohol dehydrogenase family)